MKKYKIIICLIVVIIIVYILWQIGVFNMPIKSRSSPHYKIEPLMTKFSLTTNGDFDATFITKYYPSVDILNISVYNFMEGSEYNDLGPEYAGNTSKKCTVTTKLPITLKWNDTFQITAKDCTTRKHNVGDVYQLHFDFQLEYKVLNETRKEEIKAWVRQLYE